MLTLTRLSAGLFAFWQEHFPVDTPTFYPGTQPDLSDTEGWVELWVTPMVEGVHRDGHPESLDVSLTVHVFSRHPTDTLHVQKLVDAVRQTLTQQTIPIRATSDPESDLLGWLSVREPTVQDASRTHAAQTQRLLAHAIVTFDARGLGLRA